MRAFSEVAIHLTERASWLASVARKLQHDRVRSEVARKGREQSVSRPESESFEVVERSARQRRVAEAVMQLAEPYRSTILYRYFDGLETSEIAARMGVPFEDFMEAVAAQTPVQRVGQPEDVAGVIAFLCSADASYVSGQVIYVRGGP